MRVVFEPRKPRHAHQSRCNALFSILVCELVDALLEHTVEQVRAVDSTDGNQQLELSREPEIVNWNQTRDPFAKIQKYSAACVPLHLRTTGQPCACRSLQAALPMAFGSGMSLDCRFDWWR